MLLKVLCNQENNEYPTDQDFPLFSTLPPVWSHLHTCRLVDSTFSPSTSASFPLLPISHLVSLPNCTTLASSTSPCNHSSPALLTQYQLPFIYLDPLGHSQYLSKFASKEHFLCTLNPSANSGDPTMALSTLLLWERRFPIPKTMALFVLSISCLAASNSHKPGI